MSPSELTGGAPKRGAGQRDGKLIAEFTGRGAQRIALSVRPTRRRRGDIAVARSDHAAAASPLARARSNSAHVWAVIVSSSSIRRR